MKALELWETLGRLLQEHGDAELFVYGDYPVESSLERISFVGFGPVLDDQGHETATSAFMINTGTINV